MLKKGADKNYPGLAYWIAIDWPDFNFSTFEESLSKIFMSAGFDVHSCKAIKGRGENSTSIFNSLFMTNGNYINFIFIGNVTPLDAYAASLNIVLKDHSCEKAIQILKESQRHALQKAAESAGFPITTINIMETKNFSGNPASIYLTKMLDAETRAKLVAGCNKLQFTNLVYTLVNEETEGTETIFFVKLLITFQEKKKVLEVST